MRALVTGGCGFIGANLAIALSGRGVDVTVVDRRSSHPLLEGFAGEVRVVDVAEIDESLLHRVDVMFHQAACTDTTVTDHDEMWASNVAPFSRLLQLVASTQTDLVYASSAAVYGNAPAPQRAGTGEQPLNAYGASKLEMDRLAAERIAAGVAAKIIGLRYFNVYGPGEAHKSHMASMVSKLARAMRAGTRPRIFTDGSQRRDHVYIDDVVDANLRALRADPRASGVYNVGTGVAVTFNDLVAELNRSLGTDLAPEYFDNPFDGYQNHTQADIDQATAALEYRPRHSLADGIRMYLASGVV